MYLKYKHQHITLEENKSAILLIKVKSGNLGIVKYDLGNKKFINNQAISIVKSFIISEYDFYGTIEEFLEKYPEALI